MVNWKTIAIIFILLQIFEIAFIGYGIYGLNKEETFTKECYYVVCSDYPEAEYVDGVCSCYDLDLTGQNYVLAKNKLLD